MALQTYYMGPSGGTGGKFIDPRVNSQQPQQIDAVDHFPVNTTLDEILSRSECQIREIIFNAGSYIDSITVSYVGTSDSPYGTYKMGGNGGTKFLINRRNYLPKIRGDKDVNMECCIRKSHRSNIPTWEKPEIIVHSEFSLPL